MFMRAFKTICGFIYFYIRPLYKWFLRQTTGLCELQRICYGEINGAPRSKSVERSLNLSRSAQIKQLIAHLNNISFNGRFTGDNRREIVRGAVNTVLIVKKIKPNVHFPFVTSFGKCVELIWGYKQLLAEIEYERSTTFDSDNLDHRQRLLSLWNNLRPNETLLSDVGKQWQDIGFQGEDPKTDFRGMGLLGLNNLLYFSYEYREHARHVLSHSYHPQYGYAFAIVGINLTSMAWNLVKSGNAKTYFYNHTNDTPDIAHFHKFYSYLFYEFDKFWIQSKPKNIMEFSIIKERFENSIKLRLKDQNSVFKINMSVDIV